MREHFVVGFVGVHRDHPVREPDPFGGVDFDPARRREQAEGNARGDEFGEVSCAAPGCRQADFDLDETNKGLVGEESEVAGRGNLGTTALNERSESTRAHQVRTSEAIQNERSESVRCLTSLPANTVPVSASSSPPKTHHSIPVHDRQRNQLQFP